jgi:hypothetical protein
VTQFEVRHETKQRSLERFESDVSPDDADACVALLRRRARALGFDVALLVLRTKHKKRWIEFRA